MDHQTKKQPINLRKKPRLIIIPPNTKPTRILVTPDPDKTRVWVHVPHDTTIERAEEVIDNDL